MSQEIYSTLFSLHTNRDPFLYFIVTLYSIHLLQLDGYPEIIRIIACVLLSRV